MDSFKASTRENEEITSASGSVHQITVVPKTGKISCEKMTINYFIIFSTAVFPGHDICQLRNNNNRLRSGVAR